MAFLRFFPGHTLLEKNYAMIQKDTSDLGSEFVRLETRYFGRLTPLATWRSEYLFRTRLLRSLARGKPGTISGGIGSSGRATSTKKKSAVLTYNSKLPWQVSVIDVHFHQGKKPPRALHGTAELGAATMSDPTCGKVEKWGLVDPFIPSSIRDGLPDVVLYGNGDGPAYMPNISDVSQQHGVLVGEGVPGGRAYFRGVQEMCGRYLGAASEVVDNHPEIPKIPEMVESITSVWIAKSSSVPATTQSLCGMMTGSNLGVVTAYSLGRDSNGSRFGSGNMSARWVVSPGVPIISLKIDDSYNMKRRSLQRVWAVALNALGEAYYLTETPVTRQILKGQDVALHAWLTGRSAYWNLVEPTRRVARPDERDRNALRGAYSPRSPSNAQGLSQEQIIAEAREIEQFLTLKPAHFRNVCQGWNMLRKLEVDFANDDGAGTGESIIVIDAGEIENEQARISRYVRKRVPVEPVPPASISILPTAALFDGLQYSAAQEGQNAEPMLPKTPPPTPQANHQRHATILEWHCSLLDLRGHSNNVLTTSALDMSFPALLTLLEDPLNPTSNTQVAPSLADQARSSAVEIPGRRTRLFAVGTTNGSILVWNARGAHAGDSVPIVRVIQTDSPAISCLALSSLYLVHGGSDGLAQAWDPLGSTKDPIRTLNARSNGRVPRQMMLLNPSLREGNYSAVGAIFLDPDPTVLRGVLSFGALLRYWSFSSNGSTPSRKRRSRHLDIQGRLHSRRMGAAVSGYIAAEQAELRRDDERKAREQDRLSRRFGHGTLGDLTEDEAIRYAQMVSEESYMQEEQRHASDTASADDASSLSTMTADTGAADLEIELAHSAESTSSVHETDFEKQVQQALRVSLLEASNSAGEPFESYLSGEADEIDPRDVSDLQGADPSLTPKSNSPSSVEGGRPWKSAWRQARSTMDEDEELALAIRLSLQDQHVDGPCSSSIGAHSGPPGQEDFPPLEAGKLGKGREVHRGA